MPKSRKKREVSKLAFIVTSLFHHYCDIVWNTVGVYLFAEFFFTGWQRSKRIVLSALLVSGSGSFTLGWPLVDSFFYEELCYCLLAFRSHSARRNTALIFTSSPYPVIFHLSTYFCAFIFLDCVLICLLSGQSFFCVLLVSASLRAFMTMTTYTHTQNDTNKKATFFFSTRVKTLWGSCYNSSTYRPFLIDESVLEQLERIHMSTFLFHLWTSFFCIRLRVYETRTHTYEKL